MPYRLFSDEEERTRMGDEYSTPHPTLMRPGADSGDYSYVPPSAPRPAEPYAETYGEGLPGMSSSPAARPRRESRYDRARSRLEKEVEWEQSPVGRVLSTLGRMGAASKGRAVTPSAEERLAVLEQQQEVFKLTKARAQADLTKSMIPIIQTLQPVMANLPEKEQARISEALSKIAGVATIDSEEEGLFTPKVVREVLSRKGSGRMFVERTLPFLNSEQKAVMVQRAIEGATLAELQKEADGFREENVKPAQRRLVGLLSVLVPKVEEHLGKEKGKVTIPEFTTAARSAFSDDPVELEGFDRFMADPANHKILAASGLVAPEAEVARQKAEAERPFKEKEPYTKSALTLVGSLPSWKKYVTEVNPKATIEAFNTTVPADMQQKFLEEAENLRHQRAMKEKSEGARVTVEGTRQGKQEAMVPEVYPDKYVLDVETGEEVRQHTLVSDLKGSKRLLLVDKTDLNAHRATKENQEYLQTMRAVVKGLARDPGENIAQYWTTKVQTAFGIKNIGVTLAALGSLKIRFAGALQGSRSQLSDRDVDTVAELMPTAKDTFETATQRLDVLEKIFNTMEDVLTGKKRRSALDDIYRENAHLRRPPTTTRDKSVAPVPVGR